MMDQRTDRRTDGQTTRVLELLWAAKKCQNYITKKEQKFSFFLMIFSLETKEYPVILI